MEAFSVMSCLAFAFDLFMTIPFKYPQVFIFLTSDLTQISTYLMMRLNAVALRIPTLASRLQDDR